MLNLNKQAWYARWFLLWNRCWAEFTDGRGVLAEGGRTNLCTYFWVSVGAPIFIVATHLGVIGALLYASVYYGVTRLTLGGFVLEIGVIGGAVALFYVTSRLIAWISGIPAKPREPTKPKRERKPSLILAYVKAVHSRTCPIITLED